MCTIEIYRLSLQARIATSTAYLLLVIFLPGLLASGLARAKSTDETMLVDGQWIKVETIASGLNRY